MSERRIEVVMQCRNCAQQTICGPTELLAMLRGIGMLKREAEPEIDVLRELLGESASRLPCSVCDEVGMSVLESNREWEDDWRQARCCDGCGATLDPERLELFPDARFCATCQAAGKDETDADSVEYCPRCGSIMELRTQRTGISRYVMRCPSCR